MTGVLNGEIYNYSEIRAELGDHSFCTQSDTEVLLASFSAWGVNGLKSLRGMFAGAVIDHNAERVFLFRDPIGKKPLYIAETPAGVVFGSSVLAVRALVAGEVRLNEDAVRAFWEHGYVLPHQSILEGFRPVMPGEVLEYDVGGRFVQAHSCRPGTQTTVPTATADVNVECARLLKQSITRRLHNNPHPVSLLSGGIDSTVVTQGMQHLVGGETITLASRLALSPDEPYATYAARRMGVRLRKVHMPLRSLADDADWVFSLQDEPLGMISFFMLAHLVKSAKAHGRILLTGDGGDEVFLGYGRASDWTQPFNPDAADDGIGWTVGTRPPDWMSLWGRFAVRQQLLGHMFPKVDRASAEQGVEVRSPLLDWDLVAFARGLPPSTLRGGGRLKQVLKAQLDGWPHWFVERRKIGFTFHLRWLWLTAGFRGVRELVSDESVDRFAPLLPAPLRSRPRLWKPAPIFQHFATVWKLLAWSAFERRLAQAGRSSQPARLH